MFFPGEPQSASSGEGGDFPDSWEPLTLSYLLVILGFEVHFKIF